MDMSQAIRNTYDWAKGALQSAGYSIIENPAVPPRRLDNHVAIWVEGADFDAQTLGRGYGGRVRLLVQAFRGISSVPLYDSVIALQSVLSTLISSIPTGATSVSVASVDIGTSREYVLVEVRLEVMYSGLQPA